MDLENLIEVTQEDREAAWPFRPARYSHEADHKAWHEGRYDHEPAIQAFARHRLNSTAALQLQLEEARATLRLIAAEREIVLNVDTGERRPETAEESAAFARRHALSALQESQTS